MYVPQGIKQHTTGPGSVLVAGVALISLIVAGVALGWIGFLVVLAGLFVLVFIEVWREAGAAVGENQDLQGDLRKVRQEAAAVPGLRSEIAELEGAVSQLEDANRRPRLAPEEILEVVTAHLGLIDLTERHREVAGSFADLPITRAEVSPDGDVVISAVSPQGAQEISGDVLTIMEASTGAIFGGSFSTVEFGNQVNAEFSAGNLPPEMEEILVERGSYNPHGYVLTLAGLHTPHYGQLGDDELAAVKSALTEASAALARTLSQQSRGGLGGGSEISDNQLDAEEQVENP